MQTEDDKKKLEPWTTAKKLVLGGSVVSVITAIVGFLVWCQTMITDAAQKAADHAVTVKAKELLASSLEIASKQVALISESAVAARQSDDQARAASVKANLAASAATASASAAAAEVKSRVKELVDSAYQPNSDLQRAIIARVSADAAQVQFIDSGVVDVPAMGFIHEWSMASPWHSTPVTFTRKFTAAPAVLTLVASVNSLCNADSNQANVAFMAACDPATVTPTGCRVDFYSRYQREFYSARIVWIAIGR